MYRNYIKNFIYLMTLCVCFTSCKMFVKNKSATSESKARAYSRTISLYKKLIGRDPSGQEVKQLFVANQNAEIKKVVDDILKSEAFEKEGFWRLHEQKFLLKLEGAQSWVQNARPDYCALQADFESYVENDRSGDYWGMFKNNKRWLPLNKFKVCQPHVAFNAITPEQNNLCKAFLDQVLPDTFAEYESIKNESAPESTLLQSEKGQAFIQKFIETKRYPNYKISLLKNASNGLNIRYENGSDDSANPSCNFSSVSTGGSTPYIQIQVPNDFAGMYGTPFFINRVKSSKSNRNLHRSRFVYWSHFCEGISPDAAKLNGEVVKLPEVEPFFAPDDKHKDAAGTCYTCHTRLQPMGNYFTYLSDGSNYTSDLANYPWNIAKVDPVVLPAGLWKGNSFFPQTNRKGLESFAQMIPDQKKAIKCLVDSAWGIIVHPDYDLDDSITEKAVSNFEANPSLTNLISTLVTSPQGQAYFNDGEKGLSGLKIDDEEDACKDVVFEAAEIKSNEMIGEVCSGCHPDADPAFVNDDGESIINEYAADDINSWREIYCSLEEENMPQGGWTDYLDEPEAANAQKNMLCYTKMKIQDLAKKQNKSDPTKVKCGESVQDFDMDQPPHSINK